MLGIASHVVQRYGANDPRFLHFLLDQIRQKLFATNTLQMNQVLPLISRLAHYLLSQRSIQDDAVVLLPDKEGLASLLGATPRHLNRVLKDLSESGCISLDYPLARVLDKSGLQELLAR
jgi:CRP-like cAMP-binding protein